MRFCLFVVLSFFAFNSNAQDPCLLDTEYIKNCFDKPLIESCRCALGGTKTSFLCKQRSADILGCDSGVLKECSLKYGSDDFFDCLKSSKHLHCQWVGVRYGAYK